MTESLDDLLTYEEAAREIGIALGSVKQAVNRGLLHSIKVPRERHKYLRREEVLQYRDGKQAYTRVQQAPPRSAAPHSLYSSGETHPNAEPYQDILETLQLLILVEGITRTSHLASIRDALIGVAQAYYSAPRSLGFTPPQQTRQPARQDRGVPPETDPRHSSSERIASLVHQVSEMLAQQVIQTDADEQTVQQLQDLLIRYTKSKASFSSSAAPAPATHK